MKSNSSKIIIICLSFILALQFGHGLTANVTVSPSNNITTSNTLFCNVQAVGTGTISANITWFVDLANHGSDNETLSLTSGVESTTSSSGNIEPADTAKDEVWKCQATIGNGTTTIYVNSTNTTIANSAPIINSPTTTQTIIEDQAYLTVASAADADLDGIVSWLSTDLNASQFDDEELFDIQNDGTISFTPTQDAVGNHTMAILASDGELFGGRNVIFQVVEFDDPPELEALTDQDANENEQLSYVVDATDEENDDLDYNITSDTLSGLTITELNNTQANITVTPTYQDGGVHQIMLTVFQTDNNSKLDSENFTITVNTTNRQPNITGYTNTTGTQGANLNITLYGNDSDTADTLNFSVTSSCDLSNPWTVTMNDTTAENASAFLTAYPLTNDHIACRNISIILEDLNGSLIKSNTTLNITLNLTNTNDAPTVNRYSYHSNSYSMNDMDNITVPINLEFTYTVNATDPDELTYEDEILSYTDNSSLFVINATTGEINFTPIEAQIGSYTINITVEDDEGLNDSRQLTLNIINNSVPVFASVPNLTCLEDQDCNVSLNVTDPDSAGFLNYEINLTSSSLLSGLNNTPSITLSHQNNNQTNFSYVYLNDYVGNYTYQITVSDQFGGSDSEEFNVTVTNVNDAPIFDNDQNNASDTPFWPYPVVEDFMFTFQINATDDDLLFGNENLTLQTNLTGPNTSIITVNKASSTTWTVQISPDSESDGNYTFTANLTDAAGASNLYEKNFTVFNQSEQPIIETVNPYYNTSQSSTVFSFAATQDIGNSTAIELSEGTTYSFDITFSDSDSPAANTTVTWFVNDTQVQQTLASVDFELSYTPNYFSAGQTQYRVEVEDERYSKANFTWNVTVNDVNRNPQLLSNFTDRIINATTSITNFYDRFYDPDDDTNSNGDIDGNEAYTLSYNATTSSLITITNSGQDVTLTPVETGTTVIVFTATDQSGATIDSANVTYNVTAPPEEEVESPESSSSSSGGGGGGGGSSAVPIPIQTDRDPYSLQIIVPQPITIYENDTVSAPITIKNDGSEPLEQITLSASADNNLTFSYSPEIIGELQPTEQVNSTLTIEDFRDPGTYEVMLIASVEDPEVNDTALLYINSLERNSDGEQVNTRIAFARDLLASNPECLELNDLIAQADRAVETGQYAEAQKILAAVTEGCRYLVSEAAKREEQPQPSIIEKALIGRYTNQVMIGLLIAIIGTGLLLLGHYLSAIKREDD